MSTVLADGEPVTVLPVECHENPPHPRLWIEGDPDECHPVPCLYCVHAAVAEAHSGCRHSHHGPWRSSRIAARAARWLYQIGVTAGHVVSFDAHCTGCVDGFRWRGRRPYVLGVLRGHWRCLLRGHHWPGDPLGVGICTKCCPCPGCGSKRIECDPACPEAHSTAVTA